MHVSANEFCVIDDYVGMQQNTFMLSYITSIAETSSMKLGLAWNGMISYSYVIQGYWQGSNSE